VHLAQESLSDGCVLEDFNAAVAAACAAACAEPVTRSVLEQIAREEASHAEISWRIIEFCLDRSPYEVSRRMRESLRSLDTMVRPTAVSALNQSVVAAADPGVLRRFGRLPDDEWGLIWNARLRLANRRLSGMLDRARPTFAEQSRFLA
jgi:hypothetical protein